MVFAMTLKSIMVYAADLGAVMLVISTYGLNSIFSGNVTSNTVTIGVITSPTIDIDPLYKILAISASVVASFVLLAIEWRKAHTIIRSRDISYAFTSIPAYRYYAIKSYPHFCFCKQKYDSNLCI